MFPDPGLKIEVTEPFQRTPSLWNTKKTAQTAETFKSLQKTNLLFVGFQFKLSFDTLYALCILRIFVFELVEHFGQLRLFLDVLCK